MQGSRCSVEVSTYVVDTFQDFFIAEHMKPRMHVLELISQKHVIVRPTKTPKSADKKCYFKVNFLGQEIIRIFLYIFFFIEEYQFRGTFVVIGIF